MTGCRIGVRHDVVRPSLGQNRVYQGTSLGGTYLAEVFTGAGPVLIRSRWKTGYAGG